MHFLAKIAMPLEFQKRLFLGEETYQKLRQAKGNTAGYLGGCILLRIIILMATDWCKNV